MQRGKENAFGDQDSICFFHRKRRRPRMAYGACYLKGTRIFDRGGMIAGPSPRSARWPMGIAAFGLCLPFLIKNSGSGKRWQQQKGRGPCSCCARPLSSRFGIYYKRENPLQITTPLPGSVWNGRERTFLDI